MHIRAPAIVCASRPHAETAVIARVLTADHGMVAGYVAGGRGRRLRPVLIPGNVVEAELRARSDSQLPFLTLELVESRGPWLGEPLPAAAITWVTALAATALPERQPFAPLYQALGGLLEAICVAPSARGWMMPLLSFELLLLRELGYGAAISPPDAEDWPALLDGFDRLGRALARYPLADQPLANKGGDVMAARSMLRDRLVRIGG
ncbi:MAG: recombination protein O N-terminal domain-containing protein [Novosphingobium sp.]